MADGLPQMGNLSLNESQHAPQAPAGPPGRAAYIPPHLRGRAGAANGDSAAPPPGPGFGGPRYASNHPALSLLLTSVFFFFFSRNGPPRGGNWANANAPDFSPRGPANGNTSQTPAINFRSFNPHAYGHPGHGGGSYSGGGSSNYGGGSSARGSGDGQWRDGQHIPGPANARVERELFGLPNDPSKQQTGINFAA